MRFKVRGHGAAFGELLVGFALLPVPACESQLATEPASSSIHQASQVSTDEAVPRSANQDATSRAVSTPPDLDSAAAQLTWDADADDLTWYYAHPGDYNQDGLITVNDITPLGVNFGAEGPFDLETSLSVVDGNSDGLITVNDITPIGQNFNKSIERYQAFHSANMEDYPASNTAPNGAGATLLGTVQLKNNPLLANKRRLFTLHLDNPPTSGYGWVRPLSNEYDLGTPSNLITFDSSGNLAPAAALSADPTSGDAPLIVEFDAGASTDSDGEIVQYKFDFDGDAVADLEADQSSAQHTYGSAGVFDASVTVVDDDGAEDSAGVTITVSGGGNQPPTAKLTVMPDSVPPGTTVVLDGSGSSDPEGTTLHYSFDPEGDGTFQAPTTEASLDWTYTELGEFQPALRVTDEDGLEDTAQGSLDVNLGTLERYTIDAQCEPQQMAWMLSMVVSGGRPGVVYYDAAAELGYTVRWRYPLTPSCDSWGDQRGVVKGDRYISGATVLNKAAFAYTDGSDILFISCLNADGSGNWNSSQIMADASEICSSYLILPSLAVISGKPAMICISVDALTGGSLFYNRAQDVSGYSWPTATKLIDFSTDLISTSSLCEVYSRPAIAYVKSESFQGELMYWRAADNDGDDWSSAPVEVLPKAWYGLSNTSLRMILNRPALVYYDDWTKEVGYVRSRDSYGDVWGDPLVIDSDTYANSSIDLLAVNGLPTIAYSKEGVGLCCAVAKDNRGESWNVPVVVDAGAGNGVSVKLADVDGHIAFAYHNTARANVEFAVYR